MVAVWLGLVIGASQVADADQTLRFTSNSQCVDTSRDNGVASIGCQSCSSNYMADGRAMADGIVNVHGRGGLDGTLIGCATGTGAATAIAGGATSVKISGPPGASIPLTFTYATSVTFSRPQCSGGAVIAIAGRQLEVGRGSTSGVVAVNVAAGSPIDFEASATVTCDGCQRLFDSEGNFLRFINCDNEGQAIADPVVAIDPRWPQASLYSIVALEPLTGEYVPMPPPDLDQDDDGFLQPADCDDFDPAVHPGALEIADNEIDDDCSGGDAHAVGAANGASCTTDLQCASGACACTTPDCAVKMCCDNRCGDGATDDCQSCLAAETGGLDGVCATLAAGTVCRAADDACDIPEVCDGVRRQCDGDFRKNIGETCRPAAGVCDVAETCVGSGSTTSDFKTVCPPDVQLASDHHGEPCSTGLGGTCDPGVFQCDRCLPTGGIPEACNRRDDDCDGVIDNGYPIGTGCEAGIGECRAPGSVVCSADGGTMCDAVPFAPNPESCNDRDDDCDGGVDEDFPDLGQSCTAGLGACRASGTISCSIFGEATCDAHVGSPSAEICNGVDDDCDGVIDNGACGAIAVPDSYAGAMDSSLVVTAANGVLANDVAGLGTIVVLDAGPPGGTVALADDGSFTYTPNPCTQGSDSFTYHLYDIPSDTASLPATVTIDVARRAPTFEFASPTLELAEGTGGEVIVQRRGDCAIAATVTCATQTNTAQSTDFIGHTTTMLFPAGATAQACPITTLGDSTTEGNESLYLRLTKPSAGALLSHQRVAVVTIADDDQGGVITVDATSIEVSERAGIAIVGLTRSGSTATPATVRWTTAAASATTSDFTAASGTVVFAAGETQASISIAIVDDSVVEGSEHFRVQLSSSTGSQLGEARAAVVHIVDDDTAGTIGFDDSFRDVEEQGTHSFAIRRSNAAGAATVRWSTVAGSATANDYVPVQSAVVTFAPGEAVAIITLTTTADSLVEGLEDLRLVLTAPSAGYELALKEAVVLIHDAVTLDPNTPAIDVELGGHLSFDEVIGTAEIELRRSSGTGMATVRWSVAGITAGTTDFALLAGETGLATFLPGETATRIRFTINDDALVEGRELLRLTLSKPSAGFQLGLTRRSIIEIVDNDAAGTIELAALTTEVTEHAGSAVITVMRTGASANTSATVKWTATSGSATASDFGLLAGETGIATFGPGQTTAAITVAINDDDFAEGVESLRITLASPTGGARLGAGRSGAVVIRDDDLATSYAIAPVTSAIEGSGAVTIRVTRSNSSESGAVTIRSAPSLAGALDFVALPPTVLSFAPGQTEASAVITLSDDAVVEGDEAFNVSLSAPKRGVLSPASRGVVLVIDDD